MAKKSAKRKTRAKPSVSRTIKNTASEVVSEVENASEVVLREVRDSFDFISGKVTDTAKFAADTTRAVTRKVTSKETTQNIQALLKEVEQAGENLLGVIGGHLDSLKKTILSATESTPAKAAPKRKRAATRKTVSPRASASEARIERAAATTGSRSSAPRASATSAIPGR